MRHLKLKRGSGLIVFYTSLSVLAATSAYSESCAEEIPKMEQEIQAMANSADSNLAEHQIVKAKERQAAGKEKSCLRYVGSARAAVEAAKRHDED